MVAGDVASCTSHSMSGEMSGCIMSNKSKLAQAESTSQGWFTRSVIVSSLLRERGVFMLVFFTPVGGEFLHQVSSFQKGREFS